MGAGESPWAPHGPPCPWTSPFTLNTDNSRLSGTSGTSTRRPGSLRGIGRAPAREGVRGPSWVSRTNLPQLQKQPHVGESAGMGLTTRDGSPVRSLGPAWLALAPRSWDYITARPGVSPVFLSKLLGSQSLPFFQLHPGVHKGHNERRGFAKRLPKACVS